MSYRIHRSCLHLALAGAGLSFVALSAHAASLVPPPGYYAAVSHHGGSFTCPAVPAPFTDTLDAPSKYEGSGKARDQLNVQADAEYKARTRPINDMEKGINKIVEKYMDTGDDVALRCAINWYTTWADAHALQGPAPSHTGRSLRKWALASLSGAYLHLEFSKSQPLAAYPDQAKRIQTWLGHIADQVVPEWDLGEPLKKINNHYYWAGWAVMATGIVLDRRDLFDWSVKVYDVFAGQVDTDGYLPNELARETRALGYHNYAITPIAMIAAFGKANGVDLAAQNHDALKRLAERTIAGVDDPRIFEAKSGFRQVLEGFDEQDSKLAWIEPYCWTVGCSGTIAKKASEIRPMKNTRLGGDLTAAFH